MVNKLNSDGLPSPSKVNPDGIKKERIVQETFSEYYITKKDEIIDFIESVADNADTYNYKDLLSSDDVKDVVEITEGEN